MKEIEVKILDIDPEVIVARLNELGAEKVEQGMVLASIFDFPDNRIGQAGSLLRVRKIGDRTEMVLKKRIAKGEYKMMEEIETNVADYGVAVRIFKGIGLDETRYEKYRATFRLGQVKFELDKYPAIPWFMEVEAPDEDEVQAAVAKLGFSMSQTTSMDSFEVFRKYGVTSGSFKEKGESPDYDSLFK